MAVVQITIKDSGNSIAIDVGGNAFPESKLMYTNAQLVAKDVLAFIEMIGKQINDKHNQQALHDIVKHH